MHSPEEVHITDRVQQRPVRRPIRRKEARLIDRDQVRWDDGSPCFDRRFAVHPLQDLTRHVIVAAVDWRPPAGGLRNRCVVPSVLVARAALSAAARGFVRRHFRSREIAGPNLALIPSQFKPFKSQFRTILGRCRSNSMFRPDSHLDPALGALRCLVGDRGEPRVGAGLVVNDPGVRRVDRELGFDGR